MSKPECNKTQNYSGIVIERIRTHFYPFCFSSVPTLPIQEENINRTALSDIQDPQDSTSREIEHLKQKNTHTCLHCFKESNTFLPFPITLSHFPSLRPFVSSKSEAKIYGVLEMSTFQGLGRLRLPKMLPSLKLIWVFPKIVGFPPKSSILIGFSIINHPFWGIPISGNTHIYMGQHR